MSSRKEKNVPSPFPLEQPRLSESFFLQGVERVREVSRVSGVEGHQQERTRAPQESQLPELQAQSIPSGLSTAPPPPWVWGLCLFHVLLS